MSENVESHQESPKAGGQSSLADATTVFGGATSCMICLDPFTKRTKAVPCGHCFDLICIKTWVEGNTFSSKKCPYCRTPITALHELLSDGEQEFELHYVAQPENPERGFLGLHGVEIEEREAYHDFDWFEYQGGRYYPFW
jgi:hypothetical protein